MRRALLLQHSRRFLLSQMNARDCLLNVRLERQGQRRRLRPGSPQKERATNTLLKPLDCFGERGLRNAAGSCGLTETLLLAQREEVSQVLKFHIVAPAWIAM